jgi:polar amino acid transport system substrate-binding protein
MWFMKLKYQLLLPQLKHHSFLLAVIFTFFSNIIFAEDKFIVAVGLAKPPYVIQTEDSGFELDLIRNVLRKTGKTATFVYTQFGHSSKMLDVKEIDAVITTNSKVFTDTTKLSDIYITYQNIAISLKKNNITINEIKDLEYFSIASFQKADKVLGKAFADASHKSPLFLKIADQSQQPHLLLKGRVDVLIMDINIFKYLTHELNMNNNDITRLFTFHPIFPESHYRMAFKNKTFIPLFNETLVKYKQTDEYLALRKHYNL